jgi:hypothetical protein
MRRYFFQQTRDVSMLREEPAQEFGADFEHETQCIAGENMVFWDVTY